MQGSDPRRGDSKWLRRLSGRNACGQKEAVQGLLPEWHHLREVLSVLSQLLSYYCCVDDLSFLASGPQTNYLISLYMSLVG